MENEKSVDNGKSLTADEKKAVGQDKVALTGDKKLPKAEKAKLVDTGRSAAEILDPANPKLESGSTILMPEFPKGAIYPTEEALKKEADARMKDEKGPDMKKTAAANAPQQSRSAIDLSHTSVVHPGAVPEPKK